MPPKKPVCYCSGAGRLAREAAAERPEPQLQQAGAARGGGERGPGDQVDRRHSHGTCTVAFLFPSCKNYSERYATIASFC